jgi:hypothetical protein
MALSWRKEYVRYRSFFMNIYRVYTSRRDLKMFIEIILSLFTISFFTFVALKPTALTITQLLEDIKLKESTVAKLDEKIVNIKEAQRIFTQEGSRLDILDQALPDSPTPETFTRQVEGIARLHGVKINNLVIDEVVLIGKSKFVQTQTDLENLPEGAEGAIFSLNLLGGYESLSSFLGDLENLRRPTKIDHVIINIAEVDGERLLTMSVTGRMPYLKTE